MTFLAVRFYIDFEVSLVDKRFKGFRDCAIIIRRGSWKWAWHRVILRGAPRRITFACSLFILYGNIFEGSVWRITSKLRGEAKPTISEQSDCASSLEFSCESLDWSFESFASLRHRFRLVESWPERTKLRARADSLSFPPRPLLTLCLRHVCHVVELGRYSRIPLFKQCSCLLKLTRHFLLAENVFTFKCNYYSFQIFPQFWLAKSTRIIHHNQLLMTKFGRILCLTRKWRQKCSPLQVNAPLTERTWGLGWVCFGCENKKKTTLHSFQE